MSCIVVRKCYSCQKKKIPQAARESDGHRLKNHFRDEVNLSVIQLRSLITEPS